VDKRALDEHIVFFVCLRLYDQFFLTYESQHPSHPLSPIKSLLDRFRTVYSTAEDWIFGQPLVLYEPPGCLLSHKKALYSQYLLIKMTELYQIEIFTLTNTFINND